MEIIMIIEDQNVFLNDRVAVIKLYYYVYIYSIISHRKVIYIRIINLIKKGS